MHEFCCGVFIIASLQPCRCVRPLHNNWGRIKTAGLTDKPVMKSPADCHVTWGGVAVFCRLLTQVKDMNNLVAFYTVHALCVHSISYIISASACVACRTCCIKLSKLALLCFACYKVKTTCIYIFAWLNWYQKTGYCTGYFQSLNHTEFKEICRSFFYLVFLALQTNWQNCWHCWLSCLDRQRWMEQQCTWVCLRYTGYVK